MSKEKERGKAQAKIVVVGDSGVGKTCMIHTFQKGEFPSAYIATVMDPIDVIIRCETEHPVTIVDTAGQKEFTQHRINSYKGADMFLICCSVVEPTQFNEVEKWVKEIKDDTPTAKYVLVGLKTDLRTEESVLNALRQQGMQPFPEINGANKARSIGALAYFECSALLNAGVRDVFTESCSFLWQKKKKLETGNSCCNVM